MTDGGLDNGLLEREKKKNGGQKERGIRVERRMFITDDFERDSSNSFLAA